MKKLVRNNYSIVLCRISIWQNFFLHRWWCIKCSSFFICSIIDEKNLTTLTIVFIVRKKVICHWQYIKISKKVFQNKLNILKQNAFQVATLGKSLSETMTLSYFVASVFDKTFFFIADDVLNAQAFSSVVSLMLKVWQH